ncbi:alpha/beta-Hydrolase [Purpureocillium lilacinum]|uniref:Alpha/beta-Hydrolase n=1 Tax=Purpureocillium lilacinum TaxID=33203 RepID=A0A179HI92_PURLI|nr:alpha/beta-Hydrolase [Purpureocillium lilacinum]OAQ89193.1 alpha/beta-Hydrolase [Purpureocillium lilacinum]
MATENHSIILIIGGGWHTPEHYDKLKAALEATGNEVHCPAHLSMNQARPPTAGLAEDTAKRNARGQSGGVSDLVYLCAFALPENGSMAGKVTDMGHEALMPIAFDFADDKTVLCRDPKAQLIGEIAGDREAEVEPYLASLVRWNGQLPFDYQKSMVALLEENSRKVKTFELATGRCPNLTATVVNVINQVVRRAI